MKAGKLLISSHRAFRSASALFVCAAFTIPLKTTASAQEPAKEQCYATFISYRHAADSLVPFIDIRFKNGQTAQFGFDTGGDLSLTTEDFAKKLGLMKKPLLGLDGKSFKFKGKALMGTDVEYSLGEFPLQSFMAIMSAEEFESVAGREVQGLIGKPDMQAFAVFIDPSENRIGLFYKGNITETERQALKMEGCEALPNVSVKDQTFEIEATLNGSELVKLTIDTGADTFFIPYATAKRLKLKPDAKVSSDMVFGGAIKCQFSTLNTIQLGSITLKGMRADFAEKTPPGFPMRIGMQALSKFKMLIDFPARKLYLKPLTSSESKAQP